MSYDPKQGCYLLFGAKVFPPPVVSSETSIAPAQDPQKDTKKRKGTPKINKKRAKKVKIEGKEEAGNNLTGTNDKRKKREKSNVKKGSKPEVKVAVLFFPIDSSRPCWRVNAVR